MTLFLAFTLELFSLSTHITLLHLVDSKISSAQEELGDVQQVIEDKRAEVEATQAELTTLADDLRQARDAGEAAKAEIKEELNRAADDLARAQDQLLQVTAETSRRNAECELCRDQVAQETASLQMMSNELTARQEAIDKGESQLQTELGKALKDTTNLKRRCADLATKVDSLKLALRSEQDRVRKEIEEAHAAFASKEKSISAENEALQIEGLFLLFGILSFRFTTPSEHHILQLITMYFHALPYLQPPKSSKTMTRYSQRRRH